MDRNITYVVLQYGEQRRLVPLQSLNRLVNIGCKRPSVWCEKGKPCRVLQEFDCSDAGSVIRRHLDLRPKTDKRGVVGGYEGGGEVSRRQKDCIDFGDEEVSPLESVYNSNVGSKISRRKNEKREDQDYDSNTKK